MSKRDLTAIAAGAAAGAGAVIGYQTWKRATERDMVDGRPAEFRRLDPAGIKADPETFQFKAGGDNKGVTDRLKSVESWNPTAAGKAMVFEKLDGSHVIADGHQRLGLAQRLIAKGQEGIKLDAYVMRERDGWTPRDVRAYAAIKNMHESSGQPLDMAKVMRERPDLLTKTRSLPMSDAKVADAMSLSKLSDAAFKMVVGGVVKPEYAAAVGSAVSDSTRHEGLLKEMVKAEIGSAQHARLYVGQAMAAPTFTESNLSLFGEETNTRSLLAERAKVLDKALQALKSDKRIFGLLEREAGNIESVGNKLSHSANTEKAEGAGRTAALIEKLATTRGPVSDMIDHAARAVAEGKKPAAAAREFVKNVGDTLKTGGINALTGDGAMGGPKGWQPEARAESAKVRKGRAKAEPRVQEMFGGRKWQSIISKEDIAAAKEKIKGTSPEAMEKWGKILDGLPADSKQVAKRRDGMEKAAGKANPIRVQRMEDGPKPKSGWKLGVIEPKSHFEGWSGYIRSPDGTKHRVPGPTSSSTHDTKRSFMLEANRLVNRLSRGAATLKPEVMTGKQAAKPAIEGKQGSMFGEATMADKIAAANRAIDAKGRTGDPMTEGLFGSGKLQADLVDMAKQPAAAENTYRMKYRPPSMSTLPDGLKWDYAELPRDFAGNRPDLKTSQHQFGVIKTDRPLTAAEMRAFEMEPVAGKGPAGWSDAAREASADARKADAKPSIIGKEWDSPYGRQRVSKIIPGNPAHGMGDMIEVSTVGSNEVRRYRAETIQDTIKGDQHRTTPAYQAELAERAETNRLKAESSKRQAEAAAKVKAEISAFSGAQKLNTMNAKRAENALLQQVRNNGNVISRKALVEREVAAGAKVQTIEIGGKKIRALVGKNEAFLDARAITKTGLDYAEHLSAMKPSNPNYTPGVGTPQEGYWSHKAPPTPTVNELPEGAFKGTQRDFESLSPGMRREIKRAADLESIKQKTREALGPNGDGKHRRTDGTPILPKGNVDMYGVYMETPDVKARIEHLKQGLGELPAGAIRDAADKQIAMLTEELGKRNPGWSDEARAASADARKGSNPMPKQITNLDFDLVKLSDDQVKAASKQLGVGGRLRKPDAIRTALKRASGVNADVAKLVSQMVADGPVTVEKAEKFKGTPIPPKPNATSEAERAGRINRLQNRAGAGGLSGKEAEAYVAENLAKLEALDAKRAAPAVLVETSEQRNARLAANMPRATTHEDLRKPLLKDKDVKALLKEGVVTREEVKNSRTILDLNEIAEKGRQSRYADLYPAHTSTKRGTQNEANQAAIIKNRKANAAPDSPAGQAARYAKKSGMKAPTFRAAVNDHLAAKGLPALPKNAAMDKVGLHLEKHLGGTGAHRLMGDLVQGKFAPPAPTNKPRTNADLVRNLEATAMGAKRIQPAEPAANPAAPPTKSTGRKALGLLAPVAIGATAMIAANQSAKAGESKVQQLQSAGTEAGKGVAVMGGFVAGTAVLAKGLMKAGLTAAKAAPATQAILMAGGAIHGAVTAKSGERMAGAARGAWDMSLPGMVVNTGKAVVEAARTTADRAPVNGRLSDQQAKVYAGANQRFADMRAAAAETDGPAKAKGWSNAARISAYQAKAQKQGFDPVNTPYGGKPENGPQQWANTSDTPKKR